MVRALKLTFAILFLIILVIPGLGVLAGYRTYDSGENRVMAPAPNFDPQLLDPFPGQFDAWFGDHYMGRLELVAMYQQLKLKFFRSSPDPGKVVVGKDGWLFEGGYNVDLYRNRDRFSEAELLLIKENLEERQRWCEERGIGFYVFLVPMKASVYPQYLPDNLIKVHPRSRREQLEARLKHTDIPYYSMVEVLKAASKERQVYLKGDTHWNWDGALVGYNYMASILGKKYPVFQPYPEDTFKRVPLKPKAGNLAKMIQAEGEQDMEVEVTLQWKKEPKDGYCENDSTGAPAGFPYKGAFIIRCQKKKEEDMVGKPKVFVIRDSFASIPIRWFRNQAGAATFYWDAWKYRLPYELVEAEKPDAVVIMIFEKALHKLLELPGDDRLHNPIKEGA